MTRTAARRAAVCLAVVCLAVVCLAVVCLATPAVAAAVEFFEPVRPPRPVQVMVHRGLGLAAPENTRRAIELCIEDGYEWVEIDVRLTKDGRHVVFHDERLDDKSDGTGAVADHTLAELLAVDAGAWFAPRFTGTRLLTLADALQIGKDRVNFYLDCKRVDPAVLAREVVEAGMETQVIVFGDPPLVAAVRAASRETVPVMTKWRPALGTPAAFVETHDLAAVEIDADDITADVIDRFRQAGVKTQAKVLGAAWDTPDTWRRVMAAGVDWVQTDRPLHVLVTAVRDRQPVWPVRVAWHRGAGRYAPENTLPAIELAAELGADFIEVDVRRTADGGFYLLHDAALDRTTNGRGAIAAHTAADIALLDAGAWFGRPYAGTGIPTLAAGLTAMGTASAYLDCKDIPPAAVAEVLRSRRLLERSVVYGSLEFLRELKRLEPAARVMPPLRGLEDLERVAGLEPYAVDAAWESLSPETIARCHAKGILVFSDAMGRHESVEHYRQAIAWGLDLIQTDHPARVLRAIELHATDRP